jgi:Ca2+-binding RTX toxin-like protein
LVYAGKGDDYVFAYRVYGGDGGDEISGVRVYGGRGGDVLHGLPGRVSGSILVGGPGKDYLRAPHSAGRLYGGPGDDRLNDFYSKENDMLVGGPGRDRVSLDDDGRRDVVRVRGGGVDRVDCPRRPSFPARNVLFVDASDRLSPSCKKALVLYTERPRYPYP